MIATPPPINTVQRAPLALSILCGLAGLAVVAGAGLSGFIERLASTAQVSFAWSDTPRSVALVALAGSVLALMRHDAGPPLVAGSSIVFAVVVATTLASDRLDLGDFLDAYTWRALVFVGGGAAAALAAVLGLVSLRGRGRPGWGVATLVIASGVLVCHAASARLDDHQVAANVQPAVGVAVVIAVMVLGSFIGRTGALIAAAGAVCLFPVYAEGAELSGFDRRPFLVLAALGLATIVALSVAVAVSAVRRPVVQYFTSSAPGWDGYPVEPTQMLPVQGGDTSPYGTPATAASLDAPTTLNAIVTQYEATQQIPPISEATPVMGALYEPTQAVTAVSSAPMSSSGQWASDPYGRHQMRYWDGERWTEHISNGGVAGTDRV